MLLTIDIGNSNITLGVYEDKTLKFVSRLSTDRTKTGDQYAVELKSILSLHSVPLSELDGSIISSVVPVLGPAFRHAVRLLTGTAPLMVGPGVKTGLNIKIDNPAQLGADLAVGAVAAISRYPLPCLVLDLGTATKISVIGKDGSFLGGTISSGLAISLDALASRTAQLPQISLEAPDHAIGTNTIDCMKSGLVIGCAAMLDGLIDRIEEELGEPATKIATGGLCHEVVPLCRHSIEINDDLLLEGLRVIYEKNRPSKK